MKIDILLLKGCPIEKENTLKVLCNGFAADLECKAGTEV
jgi:hypothetical protein